jgi:ribosomal protein S18 acetylase RimI-like enzyme
MATRRNADPPDAASPNRDPDAIAWVRAAECAIVAGMSILIRPARPTDIERIAAFNIELARETEGLQLDPAVVSRGVAAVLADAQKGKYFVAERDGVVVGQLMITREWSDWRDGYWWWIQSVYVDKAARRTGVYRALHEAAIGYGERDGARGIKLYVERENASAKATYVAMGMHASAHDIYTMSLATDGDD